MHAAQTSNNSIFIIDIIILQISHNATKISQYATIWAKIVLVISLFLTKISWILYFIEVEPYFASDFYELDNKFSFFVIPQIFYNYATILFEDNFNLSSSICIAIKHSFTLLNHIFKSFIYNFASISHSVSK